MSLLSMTAVQVLSRLVDLSDVLTRYPGLELLSPEDALNRRVLIRWGDGESTLALGGRTSFQRRDPRLAKELRHVLRSHSGQVSLCFPPQLYMKKPFGAASHRFRQFWSLTGVFLRVFVRHGPCGDAFMFRREGQFSGTSSLFDMLKTGTKRLLIVSSDPEHAVRFDERLRFTERGGVLRHVQVSPQNAYDERDVLFSLLASEEAPDIALFSAGPVGKCLMIDLLDVWPEHTKLIDTGHLLDHFSDVPGDP